MSDYPPYSTVVSVVYDGLCTFEFGCTYEVFGLPRPELKRPWYRFEVCAAEPGPIRGAGGLVVRAGPEGLPAGAVGERLGFPSATLSFHLKELKNAGVVRGQRVSRSLIYSPDFAAMNALLGFLTEQCCEGSSCAPPREPPREKT